ncbi:MAG: pirin family protein [Betaproteobacteria bacterium]|nr:pirin family protein [Betaproteobacteria bacterium]MBI3055348.1 pirin family protein [Betaproteobacteria bacterium]
MITLRKANERGHADHGWLDSYFSFSFAEYHDPQHMEFSSLRVINEDVVQPGKGFGTHGHRDMEIITYILAGALEHKDSMGNGSVIRPGDVQRMSAGRGVQHSEFNPSQSELVHLLQIWIVPNVRGIEPEYEETHFDAASKRGRLRLIASSEGRDGSVTIHQDASVYAAMLDGAERASHALAPGRKAYVHVARGSVTVNGNALGAGDALKANGEPEIVLEYGDNAEILLFDLP